jgi:hypothetical protein
MTPSRLLALPLGLVLATVVAAAPVDRDTALRVARAQLAAEGMPSPRLTLHSWPPGGAPRFYVAVAEPVGFAIVAADDALPPVIGVSVDTPFPTTGPERDQLVALLAFDVELRLRAVPTLPEERRAARRAAWQALRAGQLPAAPREQWPPAGSTSTGGWVETRWDQSSPYNDQCPIDSVTHVRSYAGCPAVAMAQILNYHATTYRTAFDDGDDYHHDYAGRDYWIDNDWAANGFPSFETLNATLAAAESDYGQHIPIHNDDAAALVFACGVAARQVYTSQGSGTFGVSQAWDAYVRFGLTGMELLDAGSPDLYQRLEQNMRDGFPAHLAVVDPAWSSGHNLVIDGYRSDGYYHLNYGWGGSADGWYVIPDEIPYGLTVIEGVIVDLKRPLHRDGFESGDTSWWSVVEP